MLRSFMFLGNSHRAVTQQKMMKKEWYITRVAQVKFNCQSPRISAARQRGVIEFIERGVVVS